MNSAPCISTVDNRLRTEGAGSTPARGDFNVDGSSSGRVSGCDPEGCGFESHPSP